MGTLNLLLIVNFVWFTYNLHRTLRNRGVARNNLRMAWANRRAFNLVRRLVENNVNEETAVVVSSSTDMFRADAEEHLHG